MRLVPLVTESPYVRRARRDRPACRLFCFPFAGAGASTYRDWPGLLPDSVEVVAVQLPGREDRLREEAFTAMDPLVRALGQVLRPYLDLPVALFGHSGGALLAFEVARALVNRSGTVARLVVSGHRAPQLPPRTPPLRDLPDDAFLAEIAALDGTDPAVFTDPGLRRVVLPALRADVAMWETYRYRPGPPLRGAVTALGGEHDPLVPVADLREWQAQAGGAFRYRLFPGGHFFLHESPHDIVAAIAEELAMADLEAR
ncbi:MAG TPA: alpha/beta fold hydrolase [Rugosimonospora sp.]|nr:alpha/beta fold hydrolase [Rugosimonospora sp.]